ncbi:MAG: hypothetical protein JWM09_1524 [Francisellaceae bacterium]|nr:hypothetical protein [Francisellaceae bacterium]
MHYVIREIKILGMENINLKADEKAALELRADVKECYRINAVLLRSEGWTVSMLIAQALRIHKSTVIRHQNDYLDGKLNIASGASASILNEAQTSELLSQLSENT